ncbi:hypothetical protein ACJ72_01564 [Emergomyces africanus]|uniref:Fungal-type protein kinase domain-containing protein n=1 Tax=Emergomyces africanus TaxID=1955775 RepID=A0A1B7P4W3_9EURO|nr:hypothetical protein ACJ72_01564 [Emergomyces africanus]
MRMTWDAHTDAKGNTSILKSISNFDSTGPDNFQFCTKLKVEIFKMTYMEAKAVASLYKGIKKGSLENAVDTLWLNILNMYFHPNEGFVLHPQIPLSAATEKRGNIAVARVNNEGRQELVVLCESKRAGCESRNAVWRSAVHQLTSNLNIARAEFECEKRRTIYGIVGIGRYCRIYQLGGNPGEKLVDFPLTGGRAMHIQKDQEEIHQALQELVEITSVFSSS